MNWTEEDLGKPQVLVDSADGMGHPGTFHFRSLVEEVSNGVYEAGGKPGVFTVSDICDGVVQATVGMSYSLISRDIMAAMVEIHALGHPHDGMVLISGNDKSVPAHPIAMARCDLPAIYLPGGTQLNAPDYVTSDNMWPMGRTWSAATCPAKTSNSRSTGRAPPAARASSWAARVPARCWARRSVWPCPGRR
jgi:dihydroxy-acid dehydratase